jgi:hypothetical protein
MACHAARKPSGVLVTSKPLEMDSSAQPEFMNKDAYLLTGAKQRRASACDP